jgi:DNA-binding response OmpR family regulator
MESPISFLTRRTPRERSGSATVDIYERDRATRDLIQRWLSQAGYYVREHGGSRAPADSPVDLVILATQVSTPQTLGLIRTMRVIYPTTAFLVLSSHSHGGSWCANAGGLTVEGTRVLSKPLSREQLLEAVQAVTATRRVFQVKPRG